MPVVNSVTLRGMRRPPCLPLSSFIRRGDTEPQEQCSRRSADVMDLFLVVLQLVWAPKRVVAVYAKKH